jgi:fermentation-respiration switch protein FrsA (DUF1100 family)
MYLGVPDEYDLRARALLVVRSHGLDDSCGSLGSRVVIAHASAGRLATAGWVDDGFGAGAGVRSNHLVDKATSSTVAGTGGRLACAKDVDFRTGLAWLHRSGDAVESLLELVLFSYVVTKATLSVIH